MSGMVAYEQASDHGPEGVRPLSSTGPRRLSEQWCPWCRAAHGFGYCAHASWLTHVALTRRGAHFNWR